MYNFVKTSSLSLSLVHTDAEEEDDPDVLSDPIYHMNLREYLVQFIQSFTQTQYYEPFKSSLTAQELSVLKHVGISWKLIITLLYSLRVTWEVAESNQGFTIICKGVTFSCM